MATVDYLLKNAPLRTGIRESMLGHPARWKKKRGQKDRKRVSQRLFIYA
jgi:hypothetical protein